MDGKDKNSHTFWLIMICVAFVMLVLVFLFIPRKGAGISSEPGSALNETPGATKTPSSTPGQLVKSGNQTGPEIPANELKELLAKAESASGRNDFVAARDCARKIISARNSNDGNCYEKAVAILNKSSSELLLSTAHAPEKKLYTIQKGDSLDGIAKKFNTTIEAVQVANGLDRANPIIHVGKTLSIYEGNWQITVTKSKFRLCLYDGDNIFKIYNVGTGRQNRTPVGVFVVKIKQEEPDWYLDGKRIPFGDKENILGTRWMSLNPAEATGKAIKGFGIHGTWENGSIKTENSNGGIRMSNSDVEELFRIIPYNTKITIED